jgi:N-acyl-D-amino-acid deacylase
LKSDILIKNATIIDGTGQPAYRSDLAISGGRIAAVLPFINDGAQQIIQADGLVLAPGFIDIHSHIDRLIFKNPFAQSMIFQGITSAVCGNCGIGAFPVNPPRKETLAEYLRMHSFAFLPDGISWTDFSGYSDRLEESGIAVNLVPLVPHGALRIAVMGMENREPWADELRRMQELLHVNLEQGAWGMSTGLIYSPGSFSRTEELVALAEVLSRNNALYASHVREEDTNLFSGLEEAVRIGKESGARVQVSHLKSIGQKNWGLSRKILDALEEARKGGADIYGDQYPYDATSTILAALIPRWAHEGGQEEMLKRLSSDKLRHRINNETEQAIHFRGGPTRIVISYLSTDRNKGLIGKDIGAIADVWKTSPADAVIRVILEEKAAVEAVYFALSEADVETIAADENVAVCTDGDALNAEEDAVLSPHPRSYGAFPRVLDLYVRKKGVLSLPAAIHKMTGLPAARVGFTDRGLLKPGFAADLILFDAGKIADVATFDNPHKYSVGISHLFVNGRHVISEGRLTGNAPGKVLKHARA